MRIITLNVNGIRSAERKGLARWLARAEPWDVVCLQEIKCMPDDVPRPMRAPRKSAATFHCAQRKGYSGVAIYSKVPHVAATGFGHPEFDAEGRYVEAHFRDVTVVSVYLPSGSAGPHRQASKFRFLDAFLPHLAALRARGREIVLCGDWNIAHQPIDLRELAQQPEELGLPAGGARVADARVRRARLRRRVPQGRHAARPVHVVVEPRRVVGQQRRLAHRLPDRHARHRRHARTRWPSIATAGSPTTRR